jgi:putative phage-type endonuclease
MFQHNLNNAVEFLRTVEKVNPLGSHSNFQGEWSSAALEIAEASEVLGPAQASKAFDAALAFREAVHAAAVESHGDSTSVADTESWKWLLTTHQVEQRTPEWYAETRNLLTASEVGRLFEGPSARNNLVRAKAEGQKPHPPAIAPRLAVMSNETGPMDWGTRYEPVVKSYLEKSLGCKIKDLGRIKHRAIPWVAASPDGLIESCETSAELVGRLVEIKCPTSRVIGNDIPFDYWCQMQWQMEVCDRHFCEFVEVKFRQLKEGDEPNPAALDRGWISLLTNILTDHNTYEYSKVSYVEEPWIVLEQYEWEILHLRRVTVQRDHDWFRREQSTFEAFWKDVKDARSGTWEPLPVKSRKAKAADEKPAICAIVDDDLDEGSLQSPAAVRISSVNVQRDVPEPISYTD